jgi:hypothetical protein
MAIIRYALLASLCLVAAFAHALTGQVSETFPLTDTIYGPSAGEGKLRSDGRIAFLFWVDDGRVNVTRIDGVERVAKLVFPFEVSADYYFDAVWTGSYFLVVAQNPGYELIAQLVDSSGETVGQPFALAESALWPRLAFNGKNALLLYDGDGVTTRLLDPSGAPADEARVLDNALLSWSDLHIVSNGDGFAALVPAGASTPQSLFLIDADGRKVTQQTLDTVRGSWTLVSNGSRYLAVAADLGQSIAYLFEGNGTPAARVDFQSTAGFQRSYRFPSAAWTGSRWLLAVQVENGTFTRLLELDPAGHLTVLSDLPGTTRMQLVNAGGRVVGTWREEPLGMVSAEVPLTGAARRVLFAARHQTLVATATSSTGTLFVWDDLEYGRASMRAGVRTHDGRWMEREIATNASLAAAASDGNGFVVVTRYGIGGDRIIRLDANGDPIPGGTQPFDTFDVLAIASNGDGYAVIGMQTDPLAKLLAAHLTATGVSAMREIPFDADDIVDIDVASDGDGYLAAWGVKEPCSPRIGFCGAQRIAGILLDATAVPEGGILPLTGEEHSFDLELEWNGRDYVLARNPGALVASHITPSGTPRDRHVLTAEPVSTISVVTAGGRDVVAWISNRGSLATAFTESGADGELVIDDDPRDFPGSGGWLVPIGNGALAFAFSARPEAAPIHGRSHVMARIIAPVLPARPSAPVLTVHRDGQNTVLQWTARGRVDGFRVEQRIGDGPWTETGGWVEENERTLTLSAAASTQFRVRAFNDAGAGPYSASASRRRAVR